MAKMSVVGTRIPQYLDVGKGSASARMQALIKDTQVDEDLLNVDEATGEAFSEAHQKMRDIYHDVIDEQLAAVAEEDLTERQKIGIDQQNFNPERVNELFPQRHSVGDYSVTDGKFRNPNTIDSVVIDQSSTQPLAKNEENYNLEEFARLRGVTTLDVEQQPELLQEFQRYLGKKYKAISSDLYYAYGVEGESLKGKQPTFFKVAKHIRDYNRKKYPDSTDAPMLQEGARQNEAIVKKGLVNRGRTPEEADEIIAEDRKKDPNESIILKELRYDSNIFSEGNMFNDPLAQDTFAKDFSSLSEKVWRNFNKSLTRLTPKAIEEFTDKIIKNNPNYPRTKIKELIYSFMLTYSSVAEIAVGRKIDLGRAWTDYFFMATLLTAKNKLVKYHQDKEGAEDSATKNKPTGTAIEENELSLMVGVADDMNIGRLVLEAMGFDRATREQKTGVGAFAKALVVDSFQWQEGPEDSPNFTADQQQLFIKNKVTNIKDGVFKNQLNVFTLSEAGLDVVQKATPLLNRVFPKHKIKVRTKPEVVLVENISIRKVGAESKKLLRDREEMAAMQNQAQNTPVRINALMKTVMDLIKNNFEEIMFEYKSNMNSEAALMAYQTTLMHLLDGPEFQNMKGDGRGNRGIFGHRISEIYDRDRQGNFLDDNGNITLEEAQAKKIRDNSDMFKDEEFGTNLSFMEENVGREFFYDYFWGLNTRLNVSQTVGNYQHHKISRGVIESGKPFMYNLKDALDVITFKAGIMKRFGYDKMDPLTAAKQFDSVIGDWSTINPFEVEGLKKILEIAGKKEGWGSVASIVEAIKFNREFHNPNSIGTYTSGFFTEIDGLTNGMAHSAAQAGDFNTAWRAQMFDAERYVHWAANYDEIERLQREGRIDELAKLNADLGLGPFQFTDYMDSYNKVNHEMKESIRKLWKDNKKKDIGLPSIITETASVAARTIMVQAAYNNGTQRFVAALNILNKRNHPLGRSFVKKPVMIFGYGAGAARIMEAVRMFVDDLLISDQGGTYIDDNGNKVEETPLAEVFRNAGIDIDKHLIDPLGVIAAEAINQSFGQIKEMANVLSETATEAHKQKFPLQIPTKAGYYINLGGMVHEINRSPGSVTSFEYFPGEFSMMQRRQEGEQGAKNIFDKNFNVKKPRAYSYVMDSFFDPWAMKAMYLKAATQITVLLNHADDNINMNRWLVEAHITKLKDQDYSWDKWLNNLESDTKRVIGNTALHIFDGLLVVPGEAETHANGLNKVFEQMMKNPRGHASFVEESLTFELDPSGNKIPDPKASKSGSRNPADKRWEERVPFKRLLNLEGQELAVEKDWGTWHPALDKFAFNWGEFENNPNETAARLRRDLRTTERNRRNLSKNITNIYQFFWSTTKSLKESLNKAGKNTIKENTQQKK